MKRGSGSTKAYDGEHIRQHVIGAVNLISGQLGSLIVSHSDTEVLQAFLN